MASRSRVLDRDARHVDRELAERLERDLGVNLEGRAIGEMPAGVGAGRQGSMRGPPAGLSFCSAIARE